MRIINNTQRRKLRRLALARQGLLQTRAFGSGLPGALAAIEHLGYVQIDSISVVERAHHHVLYSRVPNFEPEMSAQLLQQGEIFEYWSHAAALMPMRDFRFSLPYKNAIKSGQVHWYKEPDQRLMSQVLARIRTQGPMRSRDLENSHQKARGTWWNWKPAKKALEQLYMQGDLMVCERKGVEKIYDLTERVLPAHVNQNLPTNQEFAAHLLQQQLRCQGLVSLKGLTYLRRISGLREAVKELINSQLAQHILEPVHLPNGDIYYIENGGLHQRLSQAHDHVKILSPFDNSVIQRDRLASLFQYHYQLECYLPAAKRHYGYFCLPIMFADAFIGRMDCKTHRNEATLEVKTVYIESQLRNPEKFYRAFAKALYAFCRFQRCSNVVLVNVFPEALKRPMQTALKALKLS